MFYQFDNFHRFHSHFHISQTRPEPLKKLKKNIFLLIKINSNQLYSNLMILMILTIYIPLNHFRWE